MSLISTGSISLDSTFNLSQSFNYTPYLFYEKQFKTELNWTHVFLLEDRAGRPLICRSTDQRLLFPLKKLS
jgi:hypothetical protein